MTAKFRFHPKWILTIMGILSIFLGVLVFILPQRNHKPITLEESIFCSEYIEKFILSSPIGRGKRHGTLYTSDSKTYYVYGHILGDKQAQISKLEKGTPITFRVNPNSNFIIEFYAGTEEILNFDETQKAIASYSNGYVVLGIFVSVLGIYLIMSQPLSAYLRKRKTKKYFKNKKHLQVKL